MAAVCGTATIGQDGLRLLLSISLEDRFAVGGEDAGGDLELAVEYLAAVVDAVPANMMKLCWGLPGAGPGLAR